MIESKVYTCPYINHLQNSLSLEISYKTFIFWQCCLLGLIEVLGKLEVTSSGRNGWVVGSGSRLPHRESWRSAWRHRPINLLKVYVFHTIKRNLDWWASKPQQEPALAGWSPQYSTNSSVNKDKDIQKTVVNLTYFSAEFLEGHFLRSSFNCVICICYLYSLCLCLRKGNHSSSNFLMFLWFILNHKLYNLRMKYTCFPLQRSNLIAPDRWAQCCHCLKALLFDANDRVLRAPEDTQCQSALRPTSRAPWAETWKPWGL